MYTPLKAEVIAAASVGILERMIVLPGLVDRIGGDQFKNAKNDTITKRIPARAKGRKKALRAVGAARNIITDDLSESSIDVKLDEHFYFATDMTDENLLLDITDFGQQILAPSVRAVVEDLELKVYDTITGATYVDGLNTVEWSPEGSAAPSGGVSGSWAMAVRARRLLNEAYVQPEGRILLVGTGVEEVVLNDKNLKPGPNPTGFDNLESATLGTLAGFRVVLCPLLDDNESYAFVSNAFELATIPPAIPESLKFGATVGSEGFGLRWIRDYDSQVLSDRSIVDTYAGTASVEDGIVPVGKGDGTTNAGERYNARAVRITLN